MKSITITHCGDEHGQELFIVKQGDRYSGQLFYQEMLAVIAGLTVQSFDASRYLRTAEQHKIEAVEFQKLLRKTKE